VVETLSADPAAAASFARGALEVYGLGAAAAGGLGLALWLLVRPPPGRTHLAALAAAGIAGPLPLWLGAGLEAARSAGSSAVGAAEALAFPAGLARLSGVGAFGEAPARPSFAARVAAGGGLALAFALTFVALFALRRGRARGRGLAGFALAWCVLWGGALACGLTCA
jgi:hypothetical protein